MTDDDGYASVARHNLYVGWVIGIAKRHDLDVTHLGGNEIEVRIPPRTGSLEFFPPPRVTIRLTVPPPPDDWQP